MISYWICVGRTGLICVSLMIRFVQSVIVNLQGELSERHSLASESGSSTDSHADTPDGKDGELD